MIRVISVFRRLRSGTRGAFLISFLGTFPVLLALAILVVDMARLHQSRLYLDHVTTMSARQGLALLPNIQQAEVATRSTWDLVSGGDVRPPRDTQVDVFVESDRVRVVARAEVVLFLAPIFGLGSSELVSDVTIVSAAP